MTIMITQKLLLKIYSSQKDHYEWLFLSDEDGNGNGSVEKRCMWKLWCRIESYKNSNSIEQAGNGQSAMWWVAIKDKHSATMGRDSHPLNKIEKEAD